MTDANVEQMFGDVAPIDRLILHRKEVPVEIALVNGDFLCFKLNLDTGLLSFAVIPTSGRICVRFVLTDIGFITGYDNETKIDAR